MKLTIGSSQFPIGSDINKNLSYILAQMQEGKAKGADVLHFPECALSGYAGIDFPTLEGYDWETLKTATQTVIAEAKALNMWVILGSTHRLSGNHKPHNSLYIINGEGQIVDRYDKRFCAGNADETEGDLAHYTSGNHFCVFSIKGIRCGVLICHDYRYPELYREYKEMDVQLMFHSYHAGNMSQEFMDNFRAEVGEETLKLNPGSTFPEITMPATMISYAANNYVWISCSNSSARESCWPAFMVRPDGIINGKLQKNETELLITHIDTEKAYYDSTLPWRMRSINGQYHSGTLVEDARSSDRLSL